MNVRELIAELAELPLDLEVVVEFYCPEEGYNSSQPDEKPLSSVSLHYDGSRVILS